MNNAAPCTGCGLIMSRAWEEIGSARDGGGVGGGEESVVEVLVHGL